MAQQKLPLKDILAAVDMGAKSVWDEFTDEERKQISFWLLNRYASSVKGNRDKQELAVFKTNEYYNKNWNVLGTRHPKLQWQLLCQAGNTGKLEFHEWIGVKKKNGKSHASAKKYLQEIFPTMKDSDMDILIKLNSKKELESLFDNYGYEKVKL